MKPEIKQQWIEALRSGEYMQGTGCLKKIDPDNYDFAYHCCLGVLTEIYIKDQELSWDKGNSLGVMYFKMGSAVLDVDVRDWAGLASVDATVKFEIDNEYSKNYTCLAEANDDGMTFEEIADIIEKYL